jgi:WD40 repeat protein
MQEGSITRVSVSPDEKFFAFATVKGTVCILEKSRSLKVRRIQMSLEHQGSGITALRWNVSGNELFVGDDCGRVSVISASPFVVSIFTVVPAVLVLYSFSAM